MACRLVFRVDVLAGLLMLAFAAVPNADGQTISWVRVATVGPSARYSAAMAFDSARGEAVLFGGYVGFPEVANNETWTWSEPSWVARGTTGVIGRGAHAMTYDTDRGVIVMFGGDILRTESGPNRSTRETWEWNGTTWSLRADSGPSPRLQSAIAYDAARHETIIFGGYEGYASISPFAETWAWNGVAWTQRSGTAPPARRGAAMVYDTLRQVVVLFGGWNDVPNVPLGDTWEWDGSIWTQRSAGGPSPRVNHAMVYDERRGVTVLFGGFPGVGQFSGDTWEWNGAQWIQLSICGPVPQGSSSMVYDSVHARVILFQGANGSLPHESETWALGRCFADLDNGTGVGFPDCGIDINDLLYFLAAFEAGDLRVDLDDGTELGVRDGGVDINDLLFFLGHFEAGC